MRLRHLTLPALLCSVALAVTGCLPGSTGDGGTAQGTAGAPSAAGDTASARPADGTRAAAGDPCTLLTAADATKVLGKPVEPGKVSDGIDGSMCFYATPGGASVSVIDTKYRTEEDILAMFKAAESGLGVKVPYEKVGGVGDVAYYAPGLLFTFRHGDRFYNITALGTSDDKASSVAAARLVLGHLG